MSHSDYAIGLDPHSLIGVLPRSHHRSSVSIDLSKLLFMEKSPPDKAPLKTFFFTGRHLLNFPSNQIGLIWRIGGKRISTYLLDSIKFRALAFVIPSGKWNPTHSMYYKFQFFMQRIFYEPPAFHLYANTFLLFSTN